jgi:hypothetical protein
MPFHIVEHFVMSAEHTDIVKHIGMVHSRHNTWYRYTGVRCPDTASNCKLRIASPRYCTLHPTQKVPVSSLEIRYPIGIHRGSTKFDNQSLYC